MLVGSHASYEPPASCKRLLGAVASLLKNDKTVILRYLTGARHICILPGGELYFESKLDLDSDGSVYAAQDKTGQTATSLRYADTKSVDADRIQFFVLPGGFYHQFHINLGDVAAILYQGRLAFAVFADVGPAHKIGEGSIALHRALAHETVRDGRLMMWELRRVWLRLLSRGLGIAHRRLPSG